MLSAVKLSFASRIRDALTLGVAIPYLLGLLHLLYAPMLFTIAIGLVAIRVARSRAIPRERTQTKPASAWLVAVPCIVVFFFAWPQLLRPPLEGDTLAYHLPNAISWAQAHSLWQTGTRYWWYPGGSELFAAGILECGGRWLTPLAGAVAALLLAARIAFWGAQIGVRPWAAALVAAAFVATPIVAAQAGTLQNDLWLAAFFLEALFAIRTPKGERIRALAVCALVKPYGFVYAALAASIGWSRRRWGNSPYPVVLAATPLVLWLMRDGVLWSWAIIPPSSTAVANPFATTIAGNGVRGAVTLVTALWTSGPESLVWFLMPFAGLFYPRVRQVALAGVAACAIFLMLPFSFGNGLPQLALGSALRFALPTMAVGAVAFLPIAKQAPWVAGGLAAVVVIFGAREHLHIFENDHATWSTLPIALALVALFALQRQIGRGPIFVAVAAALLFAANDARDRAVGFYAEGMRDPAGRPTKLFDWIVRTRPSTIVAQDIRIGSLQILDPSADVFDALDEAPCAQARRLRALLAVGTDRDVAANERRHRMSAARDCGHTVYRDGAAIVVAPAASPNPGQDQRP